MPSQGRRIPKRGADAAGEVVALGSALDDRRLELLGRRLLIVALLELGAVTEVDAQIRMYSAAAEVIREPLYRWYVPLWRGTRALMAGRVDDSTALCAEAASLGADADSVNAVMLTLTQQWVRLRVEGRLAEAARLMDEHATAVFGELAGTYAVGRRGAGSTPATSRRPGGYCTSSPATSPVSPRMRSGFRPWRSWPRWLPDSAIGRAPSFSTPPWRPSMPGWWSKASGRPCTGHSAPTAAPLALLLGRHDEARSLAAAAAEAAERMGARRGAPTKRRHISDHGD